jgi:aminopeptidase N
LLINLPSCAQPLNRKESFSRQDSLRGSVNPYRSWWNVTRYHIRVAPEYADRSIRGWNRIDFDVSEDGPGRTMQIDLQQPLVIDSVTLGGIPIRSLRREGNVYFIDLGGHSFVSARTALRRGHPVTTYQLTIHYHGQPQQAVNPPWDGGWIWTRDGRGRPWMSVACQGKGASVWYPCKDHQGDEPDQGAVLDVIVPEPLVAVANGRLSGKEREPNGRMRYTWTVQSPINNYNIVPYIGSYAHISDTCIGETGRPLSLDYWVLDYNLKKAGPHFDRDVKRMIRAFEHWMGPYPFYEDGYKLVESPHLGMEHQSAIAYGNGYQNGYLGTDLSRSGYGLDWDYIIVHESGHEWFGNNLTTEDIADMWVHEGFTMYTEVLFIEYHQGKAAADAYVRGIRTDIANDRPLIGPYGVNKEGSDDMYNKGANLIHTVRQVIDDDTLFRRILRGMNRELGLRPVTSLEIEQYISRKSGKDLSRVFDQYLRTTQVPCLEYRIGIDKIEYRWTQCVPGFDMPVRLESGEWLRPTPDWRALPASGAVLRDGWKVDRNFYVTVKRTL